MACIRRDKTGSCSHHQCGFKDQTTHGYQCVDLAFDSNRGYCEVGDGCIKECPYSTHSSEENDAALRAFGFDIPLDI